MEKVLHNLPETEMVTPLDKSFDKTAQGENLLLRQAMLRNKDLILGNFEKAIRADDSFSAEEQDEMIELIPECSVEVSEAQLEGDGIIDYSLQLVKPDGRKLYPGGFKIMKDGSVVERNHTY